MNLFTIFKKFGPSAQNLFVFPHLTPSFYALVCPTMSNNEEEETLEDPVKKIREKTDLYQGKVTRSSKNDLSKELLNREEKIDPNFQPTKIHAIADYISIDSMSWMKATFRKIEYEKPSALNHIIKDEKRKKELVTAHEEHFLFRS